MVCRSDLKQEGSLWINSQIANSGKSVDLIFLVFTKQFLMYMKHLIQGFPGEYEKYHIWRFLPCHCHVFL